MSKELNHKIYSSTDCISEQTMFDYIDNKLNAKEQHSVEKHLLDCDLCSDALEGLALLKNRSKISTINQKISDRLISTPQKENKLIFFNFKMMSSIAAAIALLIGAVFLFNQFASKEMKEDTVAEIIESPPPPSSVSVTDETGSTISDSISLEKTESIVTKNTEPQFETGSGNQQQIILSEEQKQDTDTKNSIGSGKGATGSAVASGESLKETEDKTVTIPVESKNPQAGLQEFEKELTNDETKKAEEKNVTSLTLAQTAAPAQKNDIYYSEISKKTEKATKNNRNLSDKKGKDKVAKESVNEEIAGDAGYATQDIITDQENFKTEKLRSETSSNLSTDSVLIIKHEEPQFPGGNDSLMSFIKKNFVYPTSNLKWNLSMGTKLVVEFTIDTQGNISDPKIKQGINQELNEKAIEMVNKMPKWIPATKAVNYVLPIQLEIK